MIQKLGKYTIVEKLGEGAMGAVYKAYDEILGRYVAVKTMAEDIKWDQELKLRFYREARSAASLQHPNIVIIHDLGEEGKITYIVMELLEGRDLKGIIRDRERMPLESKLSIMAQVSDGLNHAHRRGIIHRDVKPGNIHVTPSGNVKILDFGIARIPSSDLTRSGVRLGTPVYMSPEQIRGGHYDERSDMFSAGIVFYEFLTYTHPFRDKNIVKTMDNILFQTQLPFAELMPDAPSGLWPVLNVCMAKEPEKRYGSMGDVARACRKLIDDMGHAARAYLAQIEQCSPALTQAADRPGAPAALTQLAQAVRETLRKDEKASYSELRALHAALEREGMLLPVPRPHQAAPPPREEPAVRRDPTVAPAQAPPRPPDVPAVDPESLAKATAMFQAGQSKLAENKPDEALGLLRQAVGILGPKEEFVQLLAEARRRIEERKKSRVGELLKSAGEALAVGQFTSALDLISGVLELEPDRSDAIEVRRQALAGIEAEKTRTARRDQGEREKAAGFKLLGDRRFRESLRALERARELLGDDTAVRIGIEEAEEGVRAEELKSRVEAELAEALQLFQADSPDKARARVDRALELAPRNQEALQLQAKIEDALQHKERAERCAVLIRDSKEALSRGSYDEASLLASEASGLDPASEAPRLAAEIAERKEATRRSEEAKLLLKKAEDALERFDYDEAELCAAEAGKVIPGNPAAAEFAARVRRERDERRRKLELNEVITEAQQTFLQGNLAQSEAHARRALGLDPENAKAKDLIARIEAAYGRMRDESIASLLGEAEHALSAGDAAAASAKARAALEIEPQHSEALAFVKRVQTAEEKRRRDEVEGLLARSRGALQQNSFEEARQLSRQVLDLDASSRTAKSLLKEIDKAERVARKRTEKEEQERAKRPQKPQTAASLEAPTLIQPVQGTSGTLEPTVIIPSLESRRKTRRTALWIGAAAAVLILAAAGGGLYWRLHQAKPPARPDASGQIAAAREALKQENYDEVIRVLTPIRDNPEAAAMLSRAEAGKLRRRIDVLLMQAQSQKEQGLIPEARETLQQILQIDPANQPALRIVTELDAADAATKSTAEQDIQIQGWVANARRLIAAGKLTEAQAEVDKVAKVRPDASQLRSLSKQITNKRAELDQRQQQTQQAAQRQERISELSRRAHELFGQAKYTEAQAALEEWLREDGGNAQAQTLKTQIAEATAAVHAFDAADKANRYEEALGALARLEKTNPSDPNLADLRKRIETRKASAKAVISIFRLGEAAAIFLDEQQIGTGELENRSIPAGRHKIGIKTSAKKEMSLTRDFVDAETPSFVYDAALPEIRAMVPGDRELISRRAFREQVMRYPVEHTHGILRGSCSGELRVSGALVEYQGSETKHSFSVPFRSLKLSIKDDKLEFVDAHDQKYTFRVSSAKVASAIKDRWDRLSK